MDAGAHGLEGPIPSLAPRGCAGMPLRRVHSLELLPIEIDLASHCLRKGRDVRGCGKVTLEDPAIGGPEIRVPIRFTLTYPAIRSRRDGCSMEGLAKFYQASIERRFPYLECATLVGHIRRTRMRSAEHQTDEQSAHRDMHSCALNPPHFSLPISV